MLTIHHLNNSRSSRIIWMLEELEIPYDIVRYQRQSSLLAPPSLKRIHPLGKAPVLDDNGRIIAESGAILEYLQETKDTDKRMWLGNDAERQECRFWLHYAEGSLMPPLLMTLAVGRLGKPPVPWPLRPVGRVLAEGVKRYWLQEQLTTHSVFINHHLSAHAAFAGEHFSIADIQMSYPVGALLSRTRGEAFSHIRDWWWRMQQRPAFQRAVERGGPFDIPVIK